MIFCVFPLFSGWYFPNVLGFLLSRRSRSRSRGSHQLYVFCSHTASGLWRLVPCPPRQMIFFVFVVFFAAPRLPLPDIDLLSCGSRMVLGVVCSAFPAQTAVVCLVLPRLIFLGCISFRFFFSLWPLSNYSLFDVCVAATRSFFR